MNESLSAFIQNIRIPDIIDIGIIAFFIYLIMVWFKKARVRFILVGMIALVAIYFLARAFGLYLTTMVFQGFFAIFLIMLVVIFQDDFRHFFERIAIWGITRKRSRAIGISFKKDIDILCGGLANLSRKKIGALVVAKGNDPLDRHLEAGIHIDAILNQVLLESIFDPHVPTHDGAIIVDGLRIKMFGCHLPLSTNIAEVGRLGTRHTAALGLVERTDALCIVVSEEHGTISVAEEGKIKQLRDISDLRVALDRFHSRRFPQQKKSLFLALMSGGNSWEKIIAIAAACGLWLSFGYRTEILRRDFPVPIEYRNLDPSIIIAEPKAKEVTVTLSGSERAFNLLNPRELKLSLDMSRIKGGENTISLNKDLIRTSAGLSTVNIVPEGISVNVYKMISRNITIELITRGRLPAGVILKEIKADPQTISVTVPSTTPVDNLIITTEPIDLRNITETLTLSPKLIVSPEIRLRGDKFPEVKVTIEVEKR